MALLLPDSTYVKVDIDGSFLVYKNRTARNREKKAPNPKEIIAKYEEIIFEFSSDEYIRYHEQTGQEALWRKEYTQYCLDLRFLRTGNEYPLMAQYYPDVAKTIPVVVNSGTLGLQAETVEELYNKIKDAEIFGAADTIKDV